MCNFCCNFARYFCAHMANEIKHTGTIIAIEGETVRVKIEQSSACSACQAKAMCTSTDKKEKIIEVTSPQPSPQGEGEKLRVGDTVEVIVEQRMGWKAVVIAYLVPLMVLVGTLAVLDMRLESEALAGVIALGVTGVYFIVLRMFREKLQREFSFKVKGI